MIFVPLANQALTTYISFTFDREKYHLISTGEVGLPTSGIVELKSENACFCPNMKLDKTYIILGYQNAKRKQLLFDDRVIAEVSTPFFERRMMKYALRYQERLQKRRQKKLRLLRKKKTR